MRSLENQRADDKTIVQLEQPGMMRLFYERHNIDMKSEIVNIISDRLLSLTDKYVLDAVNGVSMIDFVECAKEVGIPMNNALIVDEFIKALESGIQDIMVALVTNDIIGVNKYVIRTNPTVIVIDVRKDQHNVNS